MANATSTQLQELYVAYFGRAADPTGLDYWTEKGITTAKFAADMYAQAEFKDAYGSLSTESQVNQIYQNLFDREADVTGLTYWTQEINLGSLKLAEIATHLIWAAQNNTGSSDDKTALENRTNAAIAYTAKVKESTAGILAYQAESTDPWVSGSNITEAISYLSGINKDTAHTAAGVAASVTTITNTGTPATAKTITLTTGVNSGADFTGGSGADVFNADLSSTGTNTLNALDQLDGGNGTDTLNAVVAANVTPKKLTSIETIVGTASGNARTIDLVNSSDETSVTSNSSSGGILTFNNIANSASLGATSTAVGATFNYTDVTGDADSASLAIDGVTGGSTALEIDGVETITVTANGSDSAYTLSADDAEGTLTFKGSAGTTVLLDSVLAVSNFDASATTGGTDLTVINQSELSSTTDITVTGGSGNDSFTTTSHTASDQSLVGGAGNDTFTNTALVQGDTIDGGDGTDTISTDNTDAHTLDDSTTSYITNVETLSISDAFDGTLVTTSVAESINTVTLAYGHASTALATGGDAITGPAGSLTVNLGSKGAGYANAIAGTMTFTDTGSASTDSLTIDNKMINSTTGASVDVFGAQAFTSTGYENVTIDTGAGTGNTEVDISTLTITGDDDTADQTLTLRGAQAIDFSTSITGNSSGLLTIDASALTAQATGVTTFDIASTTLGAGGTASITGSEGEDIIGTLGNYAHTVKGGGGADSITGGTANDSFEGGAGNDTIAGGNGNDTILGGAGNDTITPGTGTKINVDAGAGDDTVNLDSSLSTNDTVVGGDGTDVLALDAAATATSSQGVSGFETIRFDSAGVDQDMVQFTANTGFTKIINNVAGANSISNVGTTVDTLAALHGSSTLSFARLLDNSSNSLTIQNSTDQAATITTLTVDEEETLTLADGASTAAASSLTITTLHAEDLVTLNITGKSNKVISNAIETQATAYLTTVDASTATGTVSVDASAATLALTMTGPSSKAATLTGGSKADTITTGSAADSIVGNAGADSITSGGGADSIDAGGGADVLNPGEGADSIDAGAGLDSIILTESTSAADQVQITTVYGTSSDSARNTITGDDNDTGEDSITDFKWGTDTIHVTSTAVIGFVHATDVMIGTATGDVNDATVGSFTANTLLIDDNTIDVTFADGGDIAITFVTPSATVTEARVEAAISYNITATTGGRTITTGALADTITGGSGADALSGAGGADSIVGVNGADTLTGGTGADTIIGGEGADSIVGGTGADTLTGGIDVDTISGGDGADTIVGGEGADTLTGGEGADSITGGVDVDTMTGNTDADVFNIAAADTGDAHSGADIITDFVTGTDSINMDVAAASASYAEADGSALTNEAEVVNAAFIALNGNVTYYAVYDYNGEGNGYLYYDADGTNGSDDIVSLIGFNTAAELAYTDIV